MAFSNEEIKEAQRLIAQCRKFVRQWRVLRWVVLLTGVLMLVVMVFAYYQLENLQELDAFTLEAEVGREDLKAILFERIDMLKVELKLYLMVYLHAVLGALLIMVSLYGWNRWPHLSALKARLLEMALKDQ
jgi:hypothetical protein